MKIENSCQTPEKSIRNEVVWTYEGTKNDFQPTKTTYEKIIRSEFISGQR